MASFSLRTGVCALYSISLLTSLAADDMKGSQALADAVAALEVERESSPAAGAGIRTPSPTDMSVSPASADTVRSLSPLPFAAVEDTTAEGQLTHALCLMFGIDCSPKNILSARRILRSLSANDDASDELSDYAAFWVILPSNEEKRIAELDKVVKETLADDAAQFDHQIAFLLGVHFLKQAKAPFDESYIRAVEYFGMMVERDIYRQWLPATIAYSRLLREERVCIDGYCHADIKELYATVGAQTLAQEFERLIRAPFFPAGVPYIPTDLAR